MLTQKEYNQLVLAIQFMNWQIEWGNKQTCLKEHVIALLAKFTEFEKSNKIQENN